MRGLNSTTGVIGRPWPRRPLAERFAEKWEPCPMTGCWLWTGAHATKTGYGYIKSGPDRRQLRATHAAWMIYKGSVPAGMLICHHCDTPGCVNPDHLFLGTALDNNRDRQRKGRGGDLRGTKNGSAKLTPQRVAHLRGLPWMTLRIATRLASEWGMSVSRLYHVRSGREWQGEVA